MTRGAVEDLELTKVAPTDTVINRYEDNNGTISAFLSGQVELVATGNVVAASIMERNPPKRPELKFLIKNSPCYIGMNKSETTLQRIWPALTSQVVIVMLGSAVVSQIAAQDLTFVANFIQSRNFRAFETYLVSTLIYLVLAVLLRQAMLLVGGSIFLKRRAA